MAAQQVPRRVFALREDPSLAQYVVDGRATGNKLGIGSYGSVEEVIVNGRVCAGKKIHEVLLDADNVGVGDITQNYLRECQLMSSLHHPNITQFIGLCFFPDSHLPILLMEKLDGNLDDLLESVPNIPLALKRSVLEDVAKGLHFLHTYEPQIIHRDLTAKNVLLTSSLAAKITDLGNSRMVDLQPGRLAQTLSRLPGTMVYMPPEALSSTSRYGPSLDVFSFGHLALYTLTQVFPKNLLDSTFTDPNNPDILLARSEVDRRKQYIEKLEKGLCDSNHRPLIQIVKHCLQNSPLRRPTVEQILADLQAVRSVTEDISGATLYVSRTGAVRHVKMIKEILGRQIEVDLRDTQLNEVQQQVQHLQAENERLLALQAQKDRNLQAKDDEIREKELDLQRIQRELESLQALLQRKNEPEASGHSQVSNLKTPVPATTLTLPLSLNWSQAANMPFAMGWYPLMVVVKRKVYVGGGLARSSQEKQTVMEFDFQTGEWSTLPLYECAHFGMGTVNSQLILVGGILVATGERASIVGVWNEEIRAWTYPFPQMPTARRSPSVTVYDNRWVIVIGGRCEALHTQMSIVEVLDTKLSQWYVTESAPLPLSHASVATIGNVCYILGGFTMKGTSSKKVFRVSPKDLVFQAITKSDSHASDSHQPPDVPSLWQTLPDTPYIHSTALALKGALFAVGGEHFFASRSIYVYKPGIYKWDKAGELTSGRLMCACTVHSYGMIIVAGGISGIMSSFSQTVEIAQI